MRIAIAGATGFLGAAIARALIDHEVVALPRRALEASVLPGVFDALVWAAGSREVESPAGHAVHTDDPVIAIERLRPRRVIYLSTGEIYGAAPLPFREDGPLLATSAYARTKLAGERAVEAAASAMGSLAISLRIAVAYGRDQRPAMLIPQVLRALRANHPLDLTTGLQTRDFIHVDDVARAVLATLLALAPPRTINLGTGIETRVRDLCLSLAHLLHRDPTLLRFGVRLPREGEPARYALETAVARHALDWSPRISLARGLLDLVRARASAA